MAKRRPSRGVDEGLLRPTPRPDGVLALDDTIAALVELDANGLCLQWRNCLGGTPPAHLPRWLVMRILAYRIQAAALGPLDKETLRSLRQPKGEALASSDGHPFKARIGTTREGAKLKAGALLAREWDGRLERVMVLDKGFAWNGETYGSLSQVAKAMTGTSWNGHRFFGLRTARSDRSSFYTPSLISSIPSNTLTFISHSTGGGLAMRPDRSKPTLRCAIYTRVSTEHGLEQEFNSLDNQREASEAYIKSQAHEGWKPIRTRYDDGGYSGGSMERPALKRLLDDVRTHRVDVIVVYKVDRLTRSLADFAKLVELFDAHQASFVSVTQAFNTTNSMGRLTLNVLLSFAQFEREVTGERIRDKIAASKKKGIWMGGVVPLGYRVENRALHVVEEHAAFGISSDAISRSAAWCGLRLSSLRRTSGCPSGQTGRARPLAEGSSAEAICTKSCRTRLILGG